MSFFLSFFIIYKAIHTNFSSQKYVNNMNLLMSKRHLNRLLLIWLKKFLFLSHIMKEEVELEVVMLGFDFDRVLHDEVRRVIVNCSRSSLLPLQGNYYMCFKMFIKYVYFNPLFWCPKISFGKKNLYKWFVDYW